MGDAMQTAAGEVLGLTYRYRVGTDALHGVDLSIPQGALFALLGPNGAGKTTLVQILAGLRRATRGRASVLGVECSALTYRDRMSIAYVNESQQLPTWMRVAQLEAYVAPLYPTWDASLAARLRERFPLPMDRPIRTFSRGERMKAALPCVLAPRPTLLLMDEPFSGMDAIVKDELVRGLLESAGAEGWTVLLSSHDIGELELLADRVGANGDHYQFDRAATVRGRLSPTRERIPRCHVCARKRRSPRGDATDRARHERRVVVARASGRRDANARVDARQPRRFSRSERGG
jgi:ABC-type multidrug transport system ATPase subunit